MSPPTAVSATEHRAGMPRKPDVPAAALRRLIARAFPGRADITFSRTPDGVSTQVYRVELATEVFYLRFAEVPGDDVRVDAAIHDHLRSIGVRVPEVIYAEPDPPELDRSFLVMREIPGVPLADVKDADIARRVAHDAGCDTALINSVVVDGFGWFDRSTLTWPPRGPVATYAEFASEFIPTDVDVRHRLLAGLFEDDELDALDQVVAAQQQRPLTRATLAHGDLDVTAIYVDDGAYSGIIDLGEVRGGEPEFDLGHFLLHDQETNPTELFRDFRSGHREVAGGGADEHLIRQVAILVGLRQLCRSEARQVPRGFFTYFRVAQLLNLLEGNPACAPRPE